MNKGQGFSRRVTLENLDNFAPLLGQKGQNIEIEDSANTQRLEQHGERQAEIQPLLRQARLHFSGRSIRIKKPSRSFSSGVTTRPRKGLFVSQRIVKPSLPVPSSALTLSQSTTRKLLWRKVNLPRSDVQRQPGNPTGGLRLTQARFKVENQVIDQTRYFRYSVFSQQNWGKGQPGFPEGRETTKVPFEVIILGRNHGVQYLVISHKPSGEARQGNYTTMLHWGGMGDTIKNLNLVGYTFKLYAPFLGQSQPYRIVTS